MVAPSRDTFPRLFLPEDSNAFLIVGITKWTILASQALINVEIVALL